VKPEWSVYILECKGGTLYTGIAKDVEARLKAHKAGKGAAYTRAHPPQRLVYKETVLTMSEALAREARIKGYPRERKLRLIDGMPSQRAGPGRRKGPGRLKSDMPMVEEIEAELGEAAGGGRKESGLRKSKRRPEDE
jgi:putative endonuclease